MTEKKPLLDFLLPPTDPRHEFGGIPHREESVDAAVHVANACAKALRVVVYDATPEYEEKTRSETEKRERAEYERLKAKFG